MSDFDINEYMTNGGNSSGDSSLIGTPDNGDPFGDIFGDGNLFDGVNREALPEDPFALPKAMYKWRIVGVDLRHTQNNDKKFGLFLTYEVAEGDYKKRTTKEWNHYWNPQDGSTEQQRVTSLAVLNQNLIAFGYSPEQISRFNHRNYKDLIGSEFWCMGASIPDKDDPSKKYIKLLGQKRPVGGPFTSGEDSYSPFQ